LGAPHYSPAGLTERSYAEQKRVLPEGRPAPFYSIATRDLFAAQASNFLYAADARGATRKKRGRMHASAQ